MSDCIQFQSENHLNGCQIFGRFSFIETESEQGFPHIPSLQAITNHASGIAVWYHQHTHHGPWEMWQFTVDNNQCEQFCTVSAVNWSLWSGSKCVSVGSYLTQLSLQLNWYVLWTTHTHSHGQSTVWHVLKSGVSYPGVRDNRSTLNTKTGYDDDWSHDSQHHKQNYIYTCTNEYDMCWSWSHDSQHHKQNYIYTCTNAKLFQF